MTNLNQDGYESALIGGRPIDATRLGFSASPSLMYSRGGLFARVVDLPADKAVARGVIIEGDEEGLLGDELDRLSVLPALADAIRWARLTGGAGIVLLADDGRVREALDPGNLGTIEEIQVFPLSAFAPHGPKYNDPNEKNYNQPEWYRVNNGVANFIVHETRIIPVSGDPLPAAVNQSGVPWAGRSIVGRVYPAITRYTCSLELANNILQRKQQAVYSMAGLADLVLRKQEKAVQSRISLVDSVRGVLNTVAIDTEDAYTIVDTSLSGIRDVIDEQKISVSAEVGIPVTILFGMSPGGLNATGAADFDGYHEMVEGIQRTRATPALERLVSLIFAQRTFIKPLEDWKIIWPALASPDDKEAAETREINARAEKYEMEALTAALGTSAVSEQEARDYLVALERYGLADGAAPGTGRSGSVSYATETE